MAQLFYLTIWFVLVKDQTLSRVRGLKYEEKYFSQQFCKLISLYRRKIKIERINRFRLYLNLIIYWSINCLGYVNTINIDTQQALKRI